MGTGKIIQADKIQGLADVPNFLSNPNGLLNTSGWTEGSYTAGSKPTGNFTASSGAGAFTIGRTTTNPLGVTGTSLVFTKSSGNQQGRAVETIFALPLDYRAKVLKLSASYINTSTNATDFAAGSTTTDSDMIFYTAYSTDGGTTYTVAEPSSVKLLSNSKDNSSPYDGSYQTPYNATHLKLIAYVATTSATAWSIKAVLGVSPSQYVYGTPITDWVSYTPTGSWTTNTTYTGRWRRVGDTLEIQARANLTGAPNAVGLDISIPSGLSIDSTKVAATGFYNLGTFASYTGTTHHVGNVIYKNSTSVAFVAQTFSSAASHTVGDVNATNPNTYGNGGHVSAIFSVPILGWSSSVQMSDGYDGRVVAARMSLSTDVTGASGSAALPFNIVGFDTTGSFNTSTNKYKIPVSGTYRISSHTRYTTLSAQAEAGIQLIVDGVVVDYIGTQTMAASSLGIVSGSTLRQLNAGQEVQIGRYSSNGTYTVTSSFTSFEVERISGSPTISAQETIGALYTGAPPTGTLNSSFNLVTFGTKVKDSHGAYSGGVYTVPSAGQYDIEAKISVNATFTTIYSSVDIGIYVDGSLYSFARNNYPSPSPISLNIYPRVAINSVPLKAGQTVEIRSRVNDYSGTPIFEPNAVVNQFSIVRSGGY